MLRWAFPSGGKAHLSTFSAFESMYYLKENVFRGSLLDALGNQKEYFDWSGRLMKKVECAPLVRSRKTSSLNEVEKLLCL